MAPKLNSRTHTKTAPLILPYRDPSNQLQYTLHPSLTTTNFPSPAFPNQLVPPNYDSDAEPLIPNKSLNAHEENVVGEELDQDELQRFTATGKPMPVYRHRAFTGMTDMYSLPQLLPRRYTDDSVIPAIVTGVLAGEGGSKISSNPSSTGSASPSTESPVSNIERRTSVSGGGGEKKEKKSLFGKLRRKSRDESKEKGLTKVIYMPRREYLKFFAKDLKGEYVGSEPFRLWSEGELEREFGRYKPDVPVKTGYRVPT